jgi:hypothetical protein
MNLRHAAALALVGWYLMVPPRASDHRTFIFDAPLREWSTIMGSYDSAKECANDRTAQLNFWTNDAAKGLPYRAATLDSLEHPVCIASDDPRLKGK